MTAEPLTPDDYQTLCGWWHAHGWTPPPQMFLPAIGFWIRDVAAAFVYRDPTSQMAAIEWLICNPANPPMTSGRAILALIEHMTEWCKENGATAVFTSCVQPSLGRFYQVAGFQVSDQHVTHYLKPL